MRTKEYQPEVTSGYQRGFWRGGRVPRFRGARVRRSCPQGGPMNTAVIIATANRPDSLAVTLRSLAECERRGRQVHVIVADNGTGPMPETAPEWFNADGLYVEYLKTAPGKTVAQNAAVLHTDADLLVFTDDDVTFDRRWLVELERAARDWPEHLLFGGRVEPSWPEGGPPEYLAGSEYLGLLVTRCDRGEWEGPIEDFRPLGPSMAVRREAFVDLGIRFDESIGPGSSGLSMGDEIDIALQLQKLGYGAVYVPTSTVQHIVRSEQLSLGWQLRRAIAYGEMTAYFNGADGRRLFGVPRWILRAIPSRAARAAMNFTLGRPTSAFDEAMQAGFAIGRCVAATRQSGGY